MAQGLLQVPAVRGGVVMDESLLGIHIIGGTSVPLGDPRAIVAADCSVEYIRELREKYPKAMILVRWIEEWDLLDDATLLAKHWFGTHRNAIMALCNDPQLWFIGLNEPPDVAARKFADFERVRLELLHAVGAHAAVGAWSVGCPDLPVWPKYQPVLDAMDEGDVVALHEYANSPDDVPASPVDYSRMWHIGRCARPGVIEYLRGRRIVLAESGLDEVEQIGGSWKQLGLSPQECADFYLRLDAFYQQIPEVEAICAYTLGGFGWEHFDMSEPWPLIMAKLGQKTLPSPAKIDLGAMATAARWYVEEATRKIEAGQTPLALDILHRLINVQDGLMYRLERGIHDQAL